MTFKKQEEKLNKLYQHIMKLELTETEINMVSIKGFLYSVSRLNQLQVIAFLTKIALNHNMEISEIEGLLE